MKPVNIQLLPGRLRWALPESGHTENSLAAELGVTAAVVDDWVRGRSWPRSDEIDRMAPLLGVTAEWLRGVEADW